MKKCLFFLAFLLLNTLWCPNAVVGEVIDSPINPVLFENVQATSSD